MIAKLKDTTLRVEGHGLVLDITYPSRGMAATAYSSVWECCQRFNKEPDFNPDETPKIYVFGELMTGPQYLKRLMSSVEVIGAKVKLESEEIS